MATDTFKRLIVTFALIALIIFLAINFAGRMMNNYNIEDETIKERLRYDSFEGILNDTNETASGWRRSFEEQSVFSVVAGIVVTGIFTITKQMLEFVITPFQVLALIFVDVLQIPEIIFDVIIFLLIVTAIFGIWSVLKKGD